MTTAHLDSMPTSFGTLKPVGHVLMALPGAREVAVVRGALLGAGYADERLIDFRPADAEAELRSMIERASGVAEFGYELPLMRRYLALAEQRHHWLLVHVDDGVDVPRIAAVARLAGATSAVWYRTLTVEDLL